jgi:hypothetical protein
MPRPLPWIKYWLDSLHNPKLIRLSLAERGAWWGLLGLAGELGGYDSDGALVAGGQPLTLDEIAESLHIKQADRPHLDSMVEKMVYGGSLAWNGNTLYVVNWDERQHIPTSDRPEAVKERVRLCRERQKQKPLNNPPPPQEGEGEGESNTLHPVTEYEKAAEARKLWKKVLAKLQPHMTKANFATWLKGSRGLGYNPDGLLVVEVQSRFAVDNLNRSLYSLSQRTLMEVTGCPADIQFVCPRGAKEPVTSACQTPVTPVTSAGQTPVTPVTSAGQIPVTPVTKDHPEAVRERVRRYRERARLAKEAGKCLGVQG